MRVILETKRFILQGSQDYTQFIVPGSYNWIEYTFFNLRFEWNKKFGQIELDIGLLGVNVNLSYVINKKKHEEEMKRLLNKNQKY